MANILVLVPMKISIPDALKKRAEGLLFGLHVKETKIGKHQLEVHQRFCPEQGDGRPFSGHAAARNAMLDLYLRDEHTHILWIDADLVEYPVDLASRLHALDPEGIIAPLPLVEGTNRLYDVYGFVDSKGRRMEKPYPPYPVGPMQSVGTCYLAPASLYHAGARYDPTEGHTEHYSVCKLAPRVSSTDQVIVYHADLPKYGEAWHEA
jgi:hypothetical protein